MLNNEGCYSLDTSAKARRRKIWLKIHYPISNISLYCCSDLQKSLHRWDYQKLCHCSTRHRCKLSSTKVSRTWRWPCMWVVFFFCWSCYEGRSGQLFLLLCIEPGFTYLQTDLQLQPKIHRHFKYSNFKLCRIILLNESEVPIQSASKDYHWSELILNECDLVAFHQIEVGKTTCCKELEEFYLFPFFWVKCRILSVQKCKGSEKMTG